MVHMRYNQNQNLWIFNFLLNYKGLDIPYFIDEFITPDLNFLDIKDIYFERIKIVREHQVNSRYHSAYNMIYGEEDTSHYINNRLYGYVAKNSINNRTVWYNQYPSHYVPSINDNVSCMENYVWNSYRTHLKKYSSLCKENYEFYSIQLYEFTLRKQGKCMIACDLLTYLHSIDGGLCDSSGRVIRFKGSQLEMKNTYISEIIKKFFYNKVNKTLESVVHKINDGDKKANPLYIKKWVIK